MRILNKLRKFGLGYCDLPAMVGNVAILLRALTLNIDKRCTHGIPIIFYILCTIITISYCYVYVVSMMWFVFVKCPETGDVIAAMIVFSLGIASEIGTTKFVYMFMNINLVRDVVEGYLHCDSTVIPGSRFHKNILKTLRVVKRRAIIFWAVMVGNGICFGFKPLVMPGRHLMEDSFILYGLEPMFESPNYEICYFLNLFSVFFACFLPSNITAFLIITTGYSEAQIIALSEEITHLWEDATDHYRENNTNSDDTINEFDVKNRIINKYVKEQLKDIVKKHTIHINLLGQIETAFRGAIAIEFILLIMALIAELLGGLENTYMEIPYALMQVAMDCLVGQRVMDASITFQNAVYDSKWESFDIANMKTILLMLQNSQKTLTLSAGGMTTLSYTTLMAILKSVYSAYTTLRSTIDT